MSWLAETQGMTPSGGILAHEMGLGKTIDVLCFISSHEEEDIGSNLIVVPNNLLKQWSEEFASYIEDTDESDFAIYATGNRTENIRNYRIVLTTYDTLLSDFRRGRNDVLANRWDRIFLDEAHEIRNYGSVRNAVVSNLTAESKWCLTGTPIWNKAGDLRSLKRFICPENLNSVTREQIHVRTKDVIAHTLPKYNLYDRECKFTMAQFKEYKSFERKILKATLTGEDKNGLLGNIVRLRRLCNHTSGDLRTENIGDWGANAKFTMVNEIMSNVPAGEKVVIFSTWVTTLISLRKSLVAMGHPGISMFHGGMTMTERQEHLNEFRNGHNNIMLISVKCGGVGLNLVCANHIIMFEPQYSPFSEKQAIDRVYRIGQRRDVHVHRLYLKFSIEHWMNSIKDWKNVVKRIELDDSDENEEEAVEKKLSMFNKYVLLGPQVEAARKRQEAEKLQQREQQQQQQQQQQQTESV